ncbi:uncharacterized protein LOC106011651, partial [Aplysia californica]|uniref:Uncharacterized protein LOC106011651 n=1 Tax=Aplysia californica TaxID=6500 RepID=A0ABM0ZZ41_APLCA
MDMMTSAKMMTTLLLAAIVTSQLDCVTPQLGFGAAQHYGHGEVRHGATSATFSSSSSTSTPSSSSVDESVEGEDGDTNDKDGASGRGQEVSKDQSVEGNVNSLQMSNDSSVQEVPSAYGTSQEETVLELYVDLMMGGYTVPVFFSKKVFKKWFNKMCYAYFKNLSVEIASDGFVSG